EGVTLSVVDITGEVEKQNSLDDNTVLESFLPLSTLITTEAGSALGRSSYANITDKLSGKKLNIYAMLENCSWFIRNNPLILKKWYPDENLLSSYARVMIELCADVELKSVEYEWKPPRCACWKVFEHVHEECPKNIRDVATKTLKNTSQTPRGISFGQKMIFKPEQVFQPVSKKSTANTRGKMNNPESTKEVNKKKGVEPAIEVSNSNSFDVLNSVDNDVEFGTNGGTTNLVNNGATSSGSSLMNVDNDGEFASNTYISEKIDKIKRQICEGPSCKSLAGPANSVCPDLVFSPVHSVIFGSAGPTGSDVGQPTGQQLHPCQPGQMLGQPSS
nr:hypothetical protein [Tanacetum cinerariifolium]